MAHPQILVWPDEAACAACAARLARQPGIGAAFIELQGPLGAGKTSFVRHLLRALGVQGRIKSPTYALLEPYTLADGTAVSHLDFYRFNDPREWAEAGLRELFERPGLKLVEWPEQAGGLLPTPDLRVVIEPRGSADDAAIDAPRDVRIDAGTPLGAALLAR